MYVITADQLKHAEPRTPNPDGWAAALNNAMLIFGIAAERDYIAAFLAQAAHETSGFCRLVESLNYTAERLTQVWPKRFPNVAVASAYAHNPHGLANFVYAHRMGNGDTGSGDGWTFRGRGIPMVTGRANYQLVADRLNDATIMKCPDKLATKETAAMAGAAWWAERPELNRLAFDEPDDDDEADFINISRIVNGGMVGKVARLQLYGAFCDVLRA